MASNNENIYTGWIDSIFQLYHIEQHVNYEQNELTTLGYKINDYYVNIMYQHTIVEFASFTTINNSEYNVTKEWTDFDKCQQYLIETIQFILKHNDNDILNTLFNNMEI
jgi:hypothetical protein